MLTQALQILNQPLRCYTKNNGNEAPVSPLQTERFCDKKAAESEEPNVMHNEQNLAYFLPHSNKSLLTSVDIATGVDLTELDANSPLLIFGRPFVLDTSMLLSQHRSSYHVIAAVVMYNTALWYHLKTDNSSSAAGHSNGSLAESYYRATLSHAEWALQLNVSTVEHVMQLLLATWNNRAHLLCSQMSNLYPSGNTFPQCHESMRFLLKSCRLEADECRIFHLNCFLLEHFSSGVAPAA